MDGPAVLSLPSLVTQKTSQSPQPQTNSKPNQVIWNLIRMRCNVFNIAFYWIHKETSINIYKMSYNMRECLLIMWKRSFSISLHPSPHSRGSATFNWYIFYFFHIFQKIIFYFLRYFYLFILFYLYAPSLKVSAIKFE